MERPENERDQAKNVKVHGARSIPAADENEQANEQVQQADDSQVVFGREGFFGRRGEERGLEFLSTTGKLVAHLGPEPRTVQTPSDFRGSGNRGTIDRQQDVARVDSGARGVRIGRYARGLKLVVGR